MTKEVCVICDGESITDIVLNGQKIPVCKECVDIYKAPIIYKVFLGFYRLAEAEVLKNRGLVEVAKRYERNAGKFMGASPMLTLRLMNKKFTINVKVIDENMLDTK